VDKTKLTAVLDAIKSQANCACETYQGILNDTTIQIPADRLREVMDALVDQFDYFHLSAITAQQREGQTDQIELIYHFWMGTGISLLMTLPAESPQLSSIISFLPGADFYEREVAEMFGVTFTGRKETPPLLLPDNWDQGPPFIRKEADHE
jgi:NADH:ubiquinone oxidoreductase subunit C